MLRNSLLLFFGFLLTACGGGGGSVTESYSTIRVFGDGAGVGRATSSAGVEAYFISPEIVETIYYANANADNQVTPDLNISDYPLVAQLGGYDFREGTVDGVPMTAVYKTGEPGDADSAVMYFLVDDTQLVFTSLNKLTGSPRGTYTFTGLYSVDDRFLDFTKSLRQRYKKLQQCLQLIGVRVRPHCVISEPLAFTSSPLNYARYDRKLPKKCSNCKRTPSNGISPT